jgi:hypothetical protein
MLRVAGAGADSAKCKAAKIAIKTATKVKNVTDFIFFFFLDLLIPTFQKLVSWRFCRM